MCYCRLCGMCDVVEPCVWVGWVVGVMWWSHVFG